MSETRFIILTLIATTLKKLWIVFVNNLLIHFLQSQWWLPCDVVQLILFPGLACSCKRWKFSFKVLPSIPWMTSNYFKDRDRTLLTWQWPEKVSTALFRAARFTKNKEHQWNSAGGFSAYIWIGTSLFPVHVGVQTLQIQASACQWHSETWYLRNLKYFCKIQFINMSWLGQEPLKLRWVLAAASRCLLKKQAGQEMFKDSAQHRPMLRKFIPLFLGSIGEIGDLALRITSWNFRRAQISALALKRTLFVHPRVIWKGDPKRTEIMLNKFNFSSIPHCQVHQVPVPPSFCLPSLQVCDV